MQTKFFKPIGLTLLLQVFILAVGWSQDLQSEKFNQAVEQYMTASANHDYFSGSVLIAKNGVPVFRRGYGMANHEHNSPNTPQTVFKIGSLTKQFTSMAVMQLVQAGKLSVSDLICTYLKECPEAWQTITIKNLLTHTSGIPNASSLPDWDEKHSMQPYSTDELIGLYKNLPLLFKPGEKHKYSNSNYHLLGMIIEKVTVKSYYEVLANNIFKPLGMTNTGFAHPEKIMPNRASGYYTALNEYVNAPYYNINLSFASGSLVSTLDDLLKWDMALYTEKLLSRPLLDEMFTPFKNNYGYGWNISMRYEKRILGHSGSINGFSSFLLRFPDDKVSIIVLSNSDRAMASKVALQLAAIVFNKPYELPSAQPYALLCETLEKGGISGLEIKFQELRKEKGVKPEESQELLNDIGYDLLRLGRIADAIAVFKLNTTYFPDDANTHDSLGEAYLLSGQFALALESYNHALKLDSGSNSAKAGIAKAERNLKP